MARLKLFSAQYPSRLKLFSDESHEEAEVVAEEILHELICQDCGHVITSGETPTHAVCPNCGGKRMILKLFPTPKVEEAELMDEKDTDKDTPKDPVAEIKRKSLFDSPLENKLKEFSGQTMTTGEYEKTFSEALDRESLEERGFAKVGEDGQVTIDPNAYIMQKTFSKLIISVTKTLELDPSIMNGDIKREDIIEKLEERLPEKGIIALKKAHGIPIEEEHTYSEDADTWLTDSSIIPDLELEYNNQSFGIEQFIKIIRDRYPDAPENILDLLVEKGAIQLDGTQVTIH